MRFIHAADIHLDSPLSGLAAYPDAPAAQLRNATRDAFCELVNRAIEEQVDFMIIAGDLYDGSWRDHNTGIFFCREMGRLKRAGIVVYVLFGNHDAENEMTRKLDMPDNVSCFATQQPQTFTLDALGVALHGQSFKHKETTDNLAAAYPPAMAGYYNIGVLHTALEGHSAHANYAPCSRDELYARGYQYWALGHVHEFAHWAGPALIVFPGNLQGRHIRETGRRGAVLVEVDAHGQTRFERLFIDVLRWEAVRIDAADCTTLVDVARRIGLALEAVLESDSHVPRAVRVTVFGRSAAHGELFGSESQLRNEVLARIASIDNGRLWLEKVSLETAGLLDGTGRGQHSEALGDLQEILAEASQDSAFLQQLATQLAACAARLPHELDELVAQLPAVRNGDIRVLLAQVTPALLARLADAQ